MPLEWAALTYTNLGQDCFNFFIRTFIRVCSPSAEGLQRHDDLVLAAVADDGHVFQPDVAHLAGMVMHG